MGSPQLSTSFHVPRFLAHSQKTQRNSFPLYFPLCQRSISICTSAVRTCVNENSKNSECWTPNAECIVELRLWSTSTQYPRNVGQRADYCRLSFWLGQISQSVSSASRQFAERKPGVLPVYWKPWLKPIKQWLWLWAFSGYGPDDWWVPSSGSNYVSGLAFVDRYSILFSSPIFFSFWVYLTLSSV